MKRSIPFLFLMPVSMLGQPTIEIGLQGGVHALRVLSNDDLVLIDGSSIMRINDDGSVPWAHDLGPEVQLLWLELTNADVVLAAGRWADSLGTEVHPVLMAFDAGGALLWGLKFDCGADEEYLSDMTYRSGVIHLISRTNAPFLTQGVIRIFDTGAFAWAVTPTSSNPHYDQVHAAGPGRILLSGRLPYDGELMEVNASGQMVWTGQLLLDGSSNNSVLDVLELNNDNRWVAFQNSGSPTNTIHTVELDDLGAVVPGTAMQFLLDSVPEPAACRLFEDNTGERTFSCYHAGSTHTLFQIDAAGDLQWTRRIPVFPISSATIDRYSDDRLVVASSGTSTWTTIKAVDDLQPDLPCFVNDTVPIDSALCTMAVLSDDLMPITCTPITFTPALSPLVMTTGAPCGPTSLPASDPIGSEWRLHPVPVDDVLYVQGSPTTEVRRMEVLDATGRTRLVHAGIFDDGLEVGMLPHGLYILRIVTAAGSSCRPFVRAGR